MQVATEIEKIIRNYLDEEEEELDTFFSGPTDEKSILEVEKILNVNLPLSYKWFLKEYGSGGIEGINIQGIETFINKVEDYTVVYLTNQYREKYNINPLWVVIEDIGEAIIILDTRKDNDECQVISWSQHDEDIVIEGENFGVYLLNKIKYMLE